jgi:hypothetical protein
LGAGDDGAPLVELMTLSSINRVGLK